MIKASAKKVVQAGLRRQNAHLLLKLIQTSGPISQAELARRTRLSPASVSGILQPLLASELLVEDGKSRHRGAGRRASLLTFNDRKKVSVGVVIDQGVCKVGLVGLAATVLAYAQEVYPPAHTPAETVNMTAEVIEALLANHNIPMTAVVGIGVAMPGLIDAKVGVVKVAANLDWHDVQLKSLLQTKFDLPITVEHLGQAKVIAETLWGHGVGHEHVVCIELGSGIGAGVLMDGRFLKGAEGATPEIGHTVLNMDGPECACGLHGCWETYCAAPAIHKRLRNHLLEMPLSDTPLHAESTLAELNQAAVMDDPLAQQILTETARYLARGLVDVMWNFDPDTIILSGVVAWNCLWLIEATRQILGEMSVVRNIDTPIVVTAYGVHAGVVAASTLASVRYLDELAASA